MHDVNSKFPTPSTSVGMCQIDDRYNSYEPSSWMYVSDRQHVLAARAMIRGLYRVEDRLLGSCVRVHWAAGDAGPVLQVEIYRALGGRPEVENLPNRDEYLALFGPFTVDPLEEA